MLSLRAISYVDPHPGGLNVLNLTVGHCEETTQPPTTLPLAQGRLHSKLLCHCYKQQSSVAWVGSSHPAEASVYMEPEAHKGTAVNMCLCAKI